MGRVMERQRRERVGGKGRRKRETEGGKKREIISIIVRHNKNYFAYAPHKSNYLGKNCFIFYFIAENEWFLFLHTILY